MTQGGSDFHKFAFDTKEAARRLGVTVSWMRDHRDEVPHIRMGGLIRYTQEHLDRYIRQNTVDHALRIAEERERRRRADSIVTRAALPPRQPPRPGPYLMPLEVATHLRVTPEIVKHWLKIGLMPGHKMGRQWRVAEADMQEWDDLVRELDDVPTGTRRTIWMRTIVEREIARRLGYVRSVHALKRDRVNVSIWVPRPTPL